MAVRDVDKLLWDAVRTKDVERVKSLLEAGANVHVRNTSVFWSDRQERPTLIFEANAEIAEVLLSNGANPNDRNHYQETPLHLAAIKRECLALIKILIKHGADVNAQCCRGHTPLHLAINNYPLDFFLIKELLEKGADVTIKNHDINRHGTVYISCLGLALQSREVMKLVIKTLVLKNFEKDFSNIIDLSPYRGYAFYEDALRHLNDCISEIVEMKNEKIDDLTLYDIVTKKSHNLKPFRENMISNEILRQYPIYKDIVSEKNKVCLDRGNYFKILNNMQMSLVCDLCNGVEKSKQIIVNGDCLLSIGEYLDNDTLSNLISAITYLHSILQPLESNGEMEQEASKESLKRHATELCEKDLQENIKRAKLERTG